MSATLTSAERTFDHHHLPEYSSQAFGKYEATGDTFMEDPIPCSPDRAAQRAPIHQLRDQGVTTPMTDRRVCSRGHEEAPFPATRLAASAAMDVHPLAGG